MSVVSNRYATKAFSEHPIAIWPLDDDAYYISLLTEAQANILNWTVTSCTIDPSPILPSETSPFESNSSYYEINGNSTLLSPAGGTITLESDELFTFESLNKDLSNFSINFYLYQDSVFCESYELGYRYFDPIDQQYKEFLIERESSPISKWIRFNETFDIPEFTPQPCQIIFKINVSDGGSPETYNFILHGLSVGQWSENFSSASLGSVPTAIPLSANLSGVYGVAADQYGPLSDNAYYIIEDNSFLAKNDGVPMIFGSKNCTKLQHSKQGRPSFIFPGKGFFSTNGKNEVYTLEFWLRISPNTKSYLKIFGTVDDSCDYGLYVSEGFLTLKIGNNIGSHNISEWYRPMLVHLIYGDDNAQVLINGEQVIDIPINKSLLVFPETNQWLGFFSYEDIKLFEIDCVSIYPYPVPTQVARRRLVWGQGVSSQETADSFFKGSSTSISFPNANYSANIIYPDKERWDAGYYNNLIATSNSLSVPQYSLPEIFLSGRDQNFWYESNNLVNNIEYPNQNHPKFFTFRPNTNIGQTEWTSEGPDWNEKCYLKFNNANIVNAPITAIYGVFEIEDNISLSRPLIHIVNSLSGKRFQIDIFEQTLIYKFDDIELYSINVSSQEHIIAGIHIPTIIEIFGYDISTFFSSYDFLQIYIGGSENTLSQSFETFEGKIYKIAFADSTNYNEIADHFNSNGFANYDDDTFFIAHYSSYALKPFYKYNKFFLDISVSSYWEEYYPLSFFAKYSLDANNKQYYGFDFIQFNVDYPSIIKVVDNVDFGPTWENYLMMDQAYSYPIQKNYSVFDNQQLTNFLNYADLNNNSSLNGGYAETNVFDLNFDLGNSSTASFDQIYDGGNSISTEILTQNIDSSQSSINIYATFQLIAEGANQPISSFPYHKQLSINKVVDASKQNTNSEPYKAYKTKFEIIDDTVIYPPQNINIEDIAISIHFSIKHDAILTNPLMIKNMELSSKSLNVYQPNPIGTKFSKEIYSYVKNGIYLNYKEKNPISIYKKDSPYLYLTKNSGIKIFNQFKNEKQYSVSIPINDSKQNKFYMGATQLFIKYDIDEIISSELPIFEIEAISENIEFVLIKDMSNLRYKVFARNKKNRQEYQNIRFYQNGIPVSNPFIYKNQWSVIGMVFDDPINFSSYTGSVNLFGGCRFNNISTFLSEGLNETASIIPNVWNNILTEDNITNLNWGYWYNENGASSIKKWKNLYVLAESQAYALSASDIYFSYVGTNTNVVDDDSILSISNDECSLISDVLWLNYSGKPV